jgi:hypothetical protein
MKRRAQEAPAPVVLDEAAAAWRYKWLHRWVSLTLQGEGVHVDHHGTLGERLARLEQELDRLGKRAAAERFLAGLEASAERTRVHIANLRRGGYAA